MNKRTKIGQKKHDESALKIADKFYARYFKDLVL